jgi:hypothetical protein
MNDQHPLILYIRVSLLNMNVSVKGILLDIVSCLELVIDAQCLRDFLLSEKRKKPTDLCPVGWS